MNPARFPVIRNLCVPDRDLIFKYPGRNTIQQPGHFTSTIAKHCFVHAVIAGKINELPSLVAAFINNKGND